MRRCQAARCWGGRWNGRPLTDARSRAVLLHWRFSYFRLTQALGAGVRHVFVLTSRTLEFFAER